MNQVGIIAKYFTEQFGKQEAKEQMLKNEREEIINDIQKNLHPKIQAYIKHSENLTEFLLGVFGIAFVVFIFFMGLNWITSFNLEFLRVLAFIFLLLAIISFSLFGLFTILLDIFKAYFKYKTGSMIKEETKSIDKKIEKITNWNVRIDFEKYFFKQIGKLRKKGFDEEGIQKFAEEWLNDGSNTEWITKAEMKSFCQSVLNRQQKSLLMKQLDQGKAANTAEV